MKFGGFNFLIICWLYFTDDWNFIPKFDRKLESDEEERQAMSSLPKEIYIDILLRVPVKSIIVLYPVKLPGTSSIKFHVCYGIPDNGCYMLW
ncbi:uncharacterized protein LOC113283784 isoform X3 [Papaver somniferum]|uniref:uncharacterized protein LOC113283784 isoform X3 n=1 Tax=Papaver somniferum TaxID=3469 RepID=UPI000E7002B0|nr:uncharacterized protein LOC113283784 isoform X3 [Papaver somniferum]